MHFLLLDLLKDLQAVGSFLVKEYADEDFLYIFQVFS